MDPLELEGSPNTDEEVGLGAEEGEGQGSGSEEESDMREDEGESYDEESPRLEAKGVEDVGDHKAQR